MDSKGNLSFTCESHKNKSLPWKLNINLASLRKSVMKSDSELSPNEQWQSEVPYDTRQLAIKKAVSAYTSCIVNFKNGNIQKFQMRFCCRKNPTRIFSIDSSALKIRNGNVHLFVSRLGNGKNINKSRLRIKKKDKSRIPEKIDCDSEMLYDRGAYYLLIPVDSLDCKVQKLYSEDSKPFTSIALDPGVRTFQTGYSPHGSVYKFGERKSELIKALNCRIDHLRSIRDTTRQKRTYHNIRKRLAKLEFKIKNLVNDLHNQVGSRLCKGYKCIFLPEFGTSKMLQEDLLQSETKRKMSGLAHYRFQQKLKYLGNKYKSKVVIVSEAYTTKTCGACGKIKDNVGANKTYTCETCGYCMDRDVHGARNIWIKNMT
jgi:putative transposase